MIIRFELALGWFGKYDGYDLAALTLLSHGPPVGETLRSQETNDTNDGRI
jgi:hypothetical protein